VVLGKLRGACHVGLEAQLDAEAAGALLQELQ
jgi:hypothetical protein